MTSYEEKRQYRRVPDAFIVTYRFKSAHQTLLQSQDEENDAIALDVSEGGLSADTNQEIPVGSEVSMRFRILNELSVSEMGKRREIRVDGHARYCRVTDRNNFRIGLHFKNLSDGDRNFLARFVKDQLLGKY